MNIGILHEPTFESRVSLMPEHVAQVKSRTINVIVEAGSGTKLCSDELY